MYDWGLRAINELTSKQVDVSILRYSCLPHKHKIPPLYATFFSLTHSCDVQWSPQLTKAHSQAISESFKQVNRHGLFLIELVNESWLYFIDLKHSYLNI